MIKSIQNIKKSLKEAWILLDNFDSDPINDWQNEHDWILTEELEIEECNKLEQLIIDGEIVDGEIDGGDAKQEYIVVRVPVSPIGYKIGGKVKCILPLKKDLK